MDQRGYQCGWCGKWVDDFRGHDVTCPKCRNKGIVGTKGNGFGDTQPIYDKKRQMEYLNSLIKPYPYLAYKKAINLMIYQSIKRYDLCEGDKFKIGYNIYAPHELLYEVDSNWSPTIRLDEDNRDIKEFWEMHYDTKPDGCHLTFKKKNSFYTQYNGYCYAKNHSFELVPSFTIKETDL